MQEIGHKSRYATMISFSFSAKYLLPEIDLNRYEWLQNFGVQTVSEKIIQFGLNYYKKSKNSLTTGI